VADHGNPAIRDAGHNPELKCHWPGALSSSSQVLLRLRARADTCADYTIRIGTNLIELGPSQIITVATYNGALLRMTEGQRCHGGDTTIRHA
jgi:hypothetical protein